MTRSLRIHGLSIAIVSLCFHITPCFAQNTHTTIADFKQSWLAHALKLQREIDIDSPLNEATFIGTHNSYNSVSYQIPLVRYIDPNQQLSIYDQLEMGIRSIELDTHWTLNDRLKRDILLCHSRSNHISCSTFDRNVVEGLKELREWLVANPHEIILLYIERHLDKHEPRLASILNKEIGGFIYKPTMIRQPGEHPSSCVQLPGKLTKAAILAASKQVVIITKGCDGDEPNYEEQTQFTEHWNDFVFSGMAGLVDHSPTFLDATINEFLPFPDCGQSTVFKLDTAHASLWRIFEDRTRLAQTIRHAKKIMNDEMRELVRCGVNWQTLDQLEIADTRLQAAIWSWAPDYPKEENGNCAIYRLGDGIKNIACSKWSSGFTCQEKITREIKAIPLASTWTQGESSCQTLAGKNWHFATPVNGKQLDQLKTAMTLLSMPEIWINYHLNENKQWHANSPLENQRGE